MPYDDSIDLEFEEGLTDKDRRAGLPSGFGHFHSRFHPSVSSSFRSAAQRTDVDLSPETDDAKAVADADAVLHSLFPQKR